MGRHHPEGPPLQPLMGPACRVFAGCHSLIPPGPYFNACVSDSCWPGRGRKVLCQSLEAYAELCRSRGVCPDWRNATHGLCGESGVAAGGPGLLGLPDTCLCAPRPHLPVRQGVQVLWPCAARVLRLQVSPADRESMVGTAGLPGWPGGPGGEPGGDPRGSRTPTPNLGGALPPPDLRPRTRGCPWACTLPTALPLSLPLSPCRSQSPLSVGLAEGCFCPDGHILFNSHRDICVPECRKHPAPGPPSPRERKGPRGGQTPAGASPAQSCQQRSMAWSLSESPPK